MRTILIGDIHGCYDEFMSLLDKVNYDKDNDRLIILGDFIDKGPKSFEIIDLAAESGLTSGKDPASITAASLYWASMLVGERRTQTEIAKTLGVTEVTIRNRFKELSNSLNL
jgi:Icc-related predicted phosphoesterase